MLVLHVDPSLLTAPKHASSPDEARDLIGRLNGVSAAITRDVLNVTIASDCSEVLIAAGLFPAFASVQNLLAAYGLDDEFATGDIVRIINNIIDRGQKAVDALDVEAVHLPACTLTPNPWKAAPDLLEQACERALATVAHANAVRAGEVQVAAIWSRCHPASGSIAISANAVVDSATHVHTSLSTAVIGTPPLVRSIDDLGLIVSGASVWATAQTPRDYHLAIALHISSLLKAPLSEIPKFKVGSTFPESVEHNQASGNHRFANTTLDVCAHVIIGHPKYQVSSFGQTRARDQANSYRTHITKGNPALRLMLWHVGDQYEFANIGPKKEEIIQNGMARQTYSGDYDLAL